LRRLRRERGNCFQHLVTMTNRGDAEFSQIIGGQAR
jgi:hypothetical protein